MHLIVFPNCKINLGLSVLNKRADGFHNLETVFYPIPHTDVLEIIPVAGHEPVSTADEMPSISVSGITVAGDVQQNLCIRAYQMLKQDYPALPPVAMHLHKLIPVGAGLGGGSADGSFTLVLLNELFGLQLTAQQLMDYAAKLGSDCPFFVLNKPCVATGRGEILTEIDLHLEAYSFVLVHPGIHINTGWAFSQLALHPPSVRSMAVSEAILHPVEGWRDTLVNDFEQPVFLHYPAIGAIKKYLYEQGAIYASMSGSGSSVFGIFGKSAIPPLDRLAGYSIHQIL